MDLLSSPDFSSHVERLMIQYHVPGLAIAITQDDHAASASFGYVCLKSNEQTTSDSIFDIASSAKVLTAACIALLIDEDDTTTDIQWDTTMSSLLPEDFVMPSTVCTKSITVEDILSHRTGIPAHDSSYMSTRSSEPSTPQSITRNLRNLDLAAPLRTKFYYNNILYTVATHLIETITKQSFSDFLERRFLAPLEMSSTFLQPSRALSSSQADKVVTGYIYRSATDSYDAVVPQDCPEAQGAGLVYSTVNDYIKFVRALLHRTSPISEKMYRGLVRARTIINPSGWRLKPHCSPSMYAAGLETYWYRGVQVIEHDGADPGWASRFFFLPERRFGAVVFGNAAGAGAISTILKRELIDHILGMPWTPPKTHEKKTKQGKRKGQSNETAFAPQSPPSREHPLNDTLAVETRASNAKELLSSDSGIGDLPPRTWDPTPYIGKYRNPGYHQLSVTNKDGALYIDALDRTMGFTITFKPPADSDPQLGSHSATAANERNKVELDAHLEDAYQEFTEDFTAKFAVESGKVRRMGLRLEPALKGLIWFEKECGDAA